MNFFKLISATALSAAMMAMMVTTASAQTVSQNQNLNTNSDVHVACTSSYGQNINCTVDSTANASGNQSQTVNQNGRKVVYRADGTPVYVHNVVDTAVDTNTLMVAVSTLLTGAAGVVVKIKNRA